MFKLINKLIILNLICCFAASAGMPSIDCEQSQESLPGIIGKILGAVKECALIFETYTKEKTEEKIAILRGFAEQIEFDGKCAFIKAKPDCIVLENHNIVYEAWGSFDMRKSTNFCKRPSITTIML